MPATFVIAILLFSLLGLEVLLIVWILLNKLRIQRTARHSKIIQDQLIDRYFRSSAREVGGSKIMQIREFVHLSEQIQFTTDQKERAYQDFQAMGLIRRFQRDLSCLSVFKRKQAVYFLAYFLTTDTRIALIQRLRQEKIGHVKLFLVNALKNDMDQYTVSTFIESVVGSRRFYQSRIIEILKAYLQASHSHFPDIYHRPEPEIKELFVDLAGGVYREDFRQPLLDELAVIEDHLNGVLHPTYLKMKNPRVFRLHHRLLQVLSDIYGFNLETEKYLASSDREVVQIAIRSMAKIATFEQMEKIIQSADGTAQDEARLDAVIKIIERNRLYYDRLIDFFHQDLPRPVCRVVTRTLVSRLEYLILKLHAMPPADYQNILRRMIVSGATADLIGFLNRNKNRDLERPILEHLQTIIPDFPDFLQELNDFLDPEIFARLGYPRAKRAALERPKSRPERKKTTWILRILFMAFLILPVTFLLAAIPLFGTVSFWELTKQYVLLLNEIFIFYFLAINGVYLLLAVLSAHGAIQQSRMWSIKSKSMLFEKGMLPSISIIAPAYNEAMSIVESVNSLLNLNYPEFEVVVVNDGSKDETLDRLIRHFQLERKNLTFDERIKTRPVLALYKNKDYPNLTVVDKLNGGKADALNVGVNISHNDYICGIDADSLLESESLLKLMSSMLDHDEITLALGGNIIPVNGCKVDHGQIEDRCLPPRWLARLQTIEYLRAFSLGRIGWSVMNSLLIVSGAFGLFEKQMLQECGGYLTQSTRDKDTVGEDMELVVRITKQAHLTRLNFRVDYINNALCYTEVPEELKSLLRQRNRWQRGLVDILSYHRDMILNPKFKQAGMLGMPYFFFFEMIGPLLEAQGYAAVAAGLLFGILNLEIVLVLFIVTVLLGIVVSLSALLVAEKEAISFNFRDTARLLLIAIFENFGWRQFMAIYRIKGLFSSLHETNVWGTVKRVGFQK